MHYDLLKILPIPSLKDNYIWGIVHPKRQECVIVDPGTSQPVFDFLKSHPWKLSGILITHHHWDHTNGVADIMQKYQVPVFGPANENIPFATNLVKENDLLTIAGMKFTVVDIPGHTLGHVAYYGNNFLLTGDTLFTGGCGRVFEGTYQQMLQSLDKLANFPDETFIYCGHEYTQANLQFAKQVEPDNEQLLERIRETDKLRAKKLSTVPATLLLEKQTNPFLRTHIPAVIHAAENYAEKTLPNREAVFTILRKWKDNF